MPRTLALIDADLREARRAQKIAESKAFAALEEELAQRKLIDELLDEHSRVSRSLGLNHG